MPRVFRLICPRVDLRVFERLVPDLPAATLIPEGIEVPLEHHRPEEILAACRARGVAVRGSVVADAPAG